MRIFAAVDQSVFGDAVTLMTREIAHNRACTVLLANIAPREPDVLGQQLVRKVITEPVPEDLRDRWDMLAHKASMLDAAGVPCKTLLIRGEPAPTILREAERFRADLIIMGSHGRGKLYRKLMGSVSEAVLADRRFPVLVVPRPAEEK